MESIPTGNLPVYKNNLKLSEIVSCVQSDRNISEVRIICKSLCHNALRHYGFIIPT